MLPYGEGGGSKGVQDYCLHPRPILTIISQLAEMKLYAIAVMIMMSDACDALDILNDCRTVFVWSVMTVMFVSYPYPYNRVSSLYFI